MEPRKRWRQRGPVSGTVDHFLYGSYDLWYRTHSQIWEIDERQEDIIGDKGGNHHFHMTSTRRNYEPYNGLVNTPAGWNVVSNYTDYDMWNNPSHMDVRLRTATGAELASRMSPNAPLVDVPVFLFELKDIPGMVDNAELYWKSLPKIMRLIQLAGASIISSSARRQARNANYLGDKLLEYQFGWGPLISDLVKMSGWAEAFARRFEQQQNLYGKKGLRRKINIDSVEHTYEDSSPSYFVSGDFTAWGRRSYHTIGRRWAVSRWYPTTERPHKSMDEFQVTRSLLGLNFDAATLWNILPFSWMVDWFVPVGAYLDQYRASMPAYCERVSVMTQTTTTITRKDMYVTPGITGGFGNVVLETSERSPSSVNILPGSFPFLGETQVGILASLSVTKRSAWKLT